MARYLALDWDHNQLHVVVANVRGTSVQVERAVVWQEPRVPNVAEADELGLLLRDRLKEAGIAPAPVLACVARDRLMVKDVRFPAVPPAEEPAIVRFQAVKELTDAAEDVIIDYVVTSDGTNTSNGVCRASALVIRRELLMGYQKICAVAGLKLTALTPRLLGTAACLRQVIGKTVVTPPPEPADGVIAVVVVGEKSAELSVWRGDVFLLARSLPVASNLAGDIRRNLAVYSGQQPQQPVRAVYLAGKSVGELRERLSEVTDVPVHTFDPFSGAETPTLPTGNRGSFASAVGVLHAQAAGKLEVNFLSPRQPKPPGTPHFRLMRTAIIGWVTLCVGLLVLGRVVHARLVSDADLLDREREVKAADLNRTKETAKLLKTLDDADNLVWLDELYELTSRIPDVNALRVTSLQAESARSQQSKYVGRLTIRGKLLDRSNPRKPLDELIGLFEREGYYTPQSPHVDKDTFRLVVNIERRAPTAYEARLSGEKEATKASTEESTKEETGKKGEKAKSKGSTGKGKRSRE